MIQAMIIMDAKTMGETKYQHGLRLSPLSLQMTEQRSLRMQEWTAAALSPFLMLPRVWQTGMLLWVEELRRKHYRLFFSKTFNLNLVMRK